MPLANTHKSQKRHKIALEETLQSSTPSQKVMLMLGLLPTANLSPNLPLNLDPNPVLALSLALNQSLSLSLALSLRISVSVVRKRKRMLLFRSTQRPLLRLALTAERPNKRR